MEEEICLTGLLLGTNHGCITTNPNLSEIQCNGNIPVHLQPKSSKSVTPAAGKVMFAVFRDSRGVTVSPFSEAWWKYEFCIVLWSSVEASGCSSQKTSRPTARGVLLRHDNARPHTARATQERIQELEWELPEHPPYSRAWPLVTSICLVR
jgi:hypothetical protein